MWQVDKDLLKAFDNLFDLKFYVSSDQWKNIVEQRFYWHRFYCNIFTTYLAANSPIYVFCFFVEINKKLQNFSELVAW